MRLDADGSAGFCPYVRWRTDRNESDVTIACMSEGPAQFVYLSVEAFRKLTSYQKQHYVEQLQKHIEALIREGQLHSPEHVHPSPSASWRSSH